MPPKIIKGACMSITQISNAKVVNVTDHKVISLSRSTMLGLRAEQKMFSTLVSQAGCSSLLPTFVSE